MTSFRKNQFTLGLLYSFAVLGALGGGGAPLWVGGLGALSLVSAGVHVWWVTSAVLGIAMTVLVARFQPGRSRRPLSLMAVLQVLVDLPLVGKHAIGLAQGQGLTCDAPLVAACFLVHLMALGFLAYALAGLDPKPLASAPADASQRA
jgi:hypothetical protein